MRFLSLLCIFLLSCNCASDKTFRKQNSSLSLQNANMQARVKFDLSEFDPNKPIMFEIEDFDKLHVQAAIDILDRLKENEFKDVWIRIDSYGGSVHWGMELIQAIEGYGHPITCVADSKAMSMGFYTLQACNKRYMTKRAQLMAHEPSTRMEGNAQDLLDEVKSLKVLMDGFIDQCISRMKISKKEFQDKTDNKVWYMGWEEAYAVGAIDGTISPNNLPKLLKYEVKVNNPLLLLLGQ